MEARTTKRPAPTGVERRLSKLANAKDTIAGFGPGVEMDVMTFGQFSFADLVDAVLDYTGPAHVLYATWTAAGADITRAEVALRDERFLSLRFVVDRSFASRQPKYAALLMERFGADAIRTTALHAKFAIVRGERMSVLIRTSMNLNTNPRLEYAQLSSDPELLAQWSEIAEAIWADAKPGVLPEGGASLPKLTGVASVAPGRRVRTGRHA